MKQKMKIWISKISTQFLELGHLIFLMDHKIMIQTIRGFGEDQKIVAIRNVILRNNTSILFIHEMKKELADEALIHSRWGSRICNFNHLSSIGASRGITVM